MDQLLTVDELAQLLQVSRSSIYRLLARHELPQPIRLGRCVRWRPADLAVWQRDRGG